jgi:hypothetical protein
MKTIRILTVLAGLLFLVQAAAAQVNPTISKEYSDDKIIEMIRTYKSAHSRDVVPPASLQQQFLADFPKAHDVEWETAGAVYEVEFEIKYRDFKAYYSPQGQLLMYVQEFRRAELPAMVRNAAESKYPKYKFEDIDKIRRGTQTFYKIEMEHRASDVEVKLLVGEDGLVLEEAFDY